MIVVSEQTIEQIASPHLWTDVMELALKMMADKDYHTPHRMHVDFYENSLLIMPSFGPDLFSTKLISAFPSNQSAGKPVIQGLVMLNDGNTGEPLALMNGTKLTAMRTAAVAMVGLRHLSAKSVQTLGIIGAGMQGRHMAWMAMFEGPIKKVFVFDKNKGAIEDFIEFLIARVPGIDIQVCETPDHLCRESDIIMTSTSSSEPVLPNDEQLLKGKVIIGIGSYKPDMREFPDALFKLVDKVWIDAERGKEESGDLIIPLNNGMLGEDQVHPIHNLLLDNESPGASDTKVFKTVGHALLICFAAKLIYEKALADGKGEEVSL